MRVLSGTVCGKVVQLNQESGLPDGHQVQVVLRPLEKPLADLAPGEGLRLSAGGWAEDAEELDKFLEWNRLQRKVPRR